MQREPSEGTLPLMDDDPAQEGAPPQFEGANDEVAPGGAVDPHQAPTRAITAATRALAVPTASDAPRAPVPHEPSRPLVPQAPPPVSPGAGRATLTPSPATKTAPGTGSPPPPLPPLPFPPSKDLGARPRRALPRKWRIALVAGGLLLALAIIGGQSGGRRRQGPRLQVAHDELVVNEEDLRKRKEVSPADFRSRDPRGRVTPSVAAPRPGPAPAAPPARAEELQARRDRRAHDPDELGPGASRRPPPTGVPVTVASPPAASAPRATDRTLYLAPADAAPTDGGGPGTKRGARAKGATVVSAGTALPASLAAPVVLAGGSSSVVVRVDEDAPRLAGARFLGTATYSRGRVTLRFRTLLLASGQEYDVRAEARGEDGAFGLAAGGDGGGGGSVEAEVVEDTGTDLVSDAVGGLGGSVIRSYTRKKRRGKGGGQAPTIRLEEGASLEIFIHETVETKTNE